MGVESASYISELVDTNPVVGDPVGEGDDHLRLIKTVLKTQFSGLSGTTAVTTSEAELNYVDGVTSAIQTQVDAKLPLAGGTMSGETIFADQLVTRPEIKDYAETYNASSGTGTVDLDLTTGNVFQHTASGGNVTFTFSNPPATGKAGSFTLKWVQDASDRTITWPGTVDWAAATAPDVTSGSGKVDMYVFTTFDAGTIWYGFQSGADMS
jgi:hypothetical protein